MTDAPSPLFVAATESPNHRRRSTRLLARSVGQEQTFVPAASRSLSDDEAEGEEEQQNVTVAESPTAAPQFTSPTGHLAFWIFLGMLVGALVSIFTPFSEHYIVLSDGWRFTLDALLTLMSVAYLIGLCCASIMK